MITLQQRINAFTRLGYIMKDAASPEPSSAEAEKLRKVMDRQQQHNIWFTPDNVIRSVEAIAKMLEKDKLEKWLEQYKIPYNPVSIKTIAVIMAGNIPLVGFHDFLCTLITGNRILARTSSKDSELIRTVAEILCRINSRFSENIIFTDRILSGYDAIIATGSDNTSRYFEYYFGKKPHIFRKNRNSVAILSKHTDEKDIRSLAIDIFSYYGLGCRNVSKLFIEEGMNINDLSYYWQQWSQLLCHSPYANNYLYNKSLLNINKQEYIDTGFSLLTPGTSLTSPVSVIHYDLFNNMKSLMEELHLQADKIQCIVSENHIAFGQTQFPGPGEYADNTDTLDFIISL
ncbi:MAG TPA: acyl-CoA reductase [Bacteroidales bacterium]|nr:acyl-CoA reductase [Bacteroidales bacterium]